MAINENVPGVEAAVTVNGNDLKEYVDEDLEEGNENELTRYIEAEDGANFGIRYEIKRQFIREGEAVTVKTYIDGHYAESVVKPAWKYSGKAIKGRIDSAYINPDTKTKFAFSTIETSSEHGYGLAHDHKLVKKMGTIEVVIDANKRDESKTPQKGHNFVNLEKFHIDIVSEKALKGASLTHGTKMTDEIKAKPRSWPSPRIPGSTRILARFIFRYRSYEALKALMIIPRTPTLVPLEDRNPEDLSPQEMMEALRRSQAKRKSQEETAKKVKRERADGDAGMTPRKAPRCSTNNSQVNAVEDDEVREASPPAQVKDMPAPVVIEID
ncbi:MAG: hypothetical protein M1820_000354 [Bogoriella megaspora]|nr:MAG: hypothetical protein M1820_000354 [Bogoriella megaspora]